MIHNLIDLLLSLLPGSRRDPASFESRVRRSADRYTNVIARAAATDAAIQGRVVSGALRNRDRHRAAAAVHSNRAHAFDRIADGRPAAL